MWRLWQRLCLMARIAVASCLLVFGIAGAWIEVGITQTLGANASLSGRQTHHGIARETVGLPLCQRHPNLISSPTRDQAAPSMRPRGNPGRKRYTVPKGRGTAMLVEHFQEPQCKEGVLRWLFL